MYILYGAKSENRRMYYKKNKIPLDKVQPNVLNEKKKLNGLSVLRGRE